MLVLFVWLDLEVWIWILGAVGEVFMARVLAGGKVTIPLLVREVLKIERAHTESSNIAVVKNRIIFQFP